MNRNNKISKNYETQKLLYNNRVTAKKLERQNKNKGGTEDGETK